MAWRRLLLCLLWLGQLDYCFVAAQVAISQRLCLWPQLETKTITCSSDGSSLIFIKSIVMTRLLGGLTTCTIAKTSDAPELIDCRVTLGTRDSYYADINRLCADKPSCNIHGSGNVAAYVGQSLCGFGMENSTIRNLVVLTLQCYAVQVTQAATTASTRTTTTEVSISQRLCVWPQLETKTITCSSDGSSLIFIKSIVMTRLLGGITTCTIAKANDAPELIDCRVTLGTRDSYYADISRLCADKPSCNIHGSGNVAAYLGQSLCGFGMENSTLRNLAVLTLQCYTAGPSILSVTTTSTGNTTIQRPFTSTNPVTEREDGDGHFTTPASRAMSSIRIDEAFRGTKKPINVGKEELQYLASSVFVRSSGVCNAGNTVGLSLVLAAFYLVRMV